MGKFFNQKGLGDFCHLIKFCEEKRSHFVFVVFNIDLLFGGALGFHDADENEAKVLVAVPDCYVKWEFIIFV